MHSLALVTAYVVVFLPSAWTGNSGYGVKQRYVEFLDERVASLREHAASCYGTAQVWAAKEGVTTPSDCDVEVVYDDPSQGCLEARDRLARELMCTIRELGRQLEALCSGVAEDCGAVFLEDCGRDSGSAGETIYTCLEKDSDDALATLDNFRRHVDTATSMLQHIWTLQCPAEDLSWHG